MAEPVPAVKSACGVSVTRAPIVEAAGRAVTMQGGSTTGEAFGTLRHFIEHAEMGVSGG